MKITDLIPGNQVSDIGDKISYKILSTINPNNLSPLELWEELTILNKNTVIYWIQNNLTEKFYLLYTYYLKNKMSHRVYLADKESVIKFIDDNFDEDWGEGIDIMISDTNYENVIMGNHDGVLVKRLDDMSTNRL